MNKTFCYFGMVAGSIVFACAFVMFVLPTTGDDVMKMRVISAAVALGAAFSFYRACYHYRHSEEPKGWEGSRKLIEQMESWGEVVRYFFNPMQMRSRTAWDLVILVALIIFKTKFAIVLAVLLVGLKCWMLFSEMRYWKTYHKLKELENMTEVTYDHEDAVMEVRGQDIIIVDPCYFCADTDFWEANWQHFCNNELTEEMGFRNALSFSVSDYQITDLVDDAGAVVGSWSSDSNTVGCYLLDDVLRINPDFAKELECGMVIRNFSGQVRFHFEQKTSPWTFYGQEVEEDAVVLYIEGAGNRQFHSQEVDL
ncbi:MAG: hypothetical protein MJZ86_09405 [Bacteroidales bacterium]|nr:hypothetical protein [Bacteroidales bacterium]